MNSTEQKTTATRSCGIIINRGPIDELKGRSSYDTILEADQARALAQFMRRVTFATCERHSTSPQEADQMMDALCLLRRTLNEAGYDPR